MRLTEEQKRKVEENHDLIYWYMRRHNLDFDEYYDACAMGLCRAAASYDPSKGIAFSTLAYKCMSNEVVRYWRYVNRPMRNTMYEAFSLQAPFRKCPDERNLSRMEMYQCPGDGGRSPDDRVFAKEFISSLPDKERIVIEMRLYGFQQNEISDVIGCSRQNVSQIMKKIGRRYMEGV